MNILCVCLFSRTVLSVERQIESALSPPFLLSVWPVSPQACLGNGPVLIALIQVRNIAFNDV